MMHFQGDVFVTGCAGSTIHVFDLNTASLRLTFQGHSDSVDFIEFDGETIVSAGPDKYVKSLYAYDFCSVKKTFYISIK